MSLLTSVERRDGCLLLHEDVVDVEVPEHPHPPLIVKSVGMTSVYAPGEWLTVVTVDGESPEADAVRASAEPVPLQAVAS